MPQLQQVSLCPWMGPKRRACSPYFHLKRKWMQWRHSLLGSMCAFVPVLLACLTVCPCAPCCLMKCAFWSLRICMLNPGTVLG
eukprot:scaffold113864_cov14-Tisochrysis_lutea.AAC.1